MRYITHILILLALLSPTYASAMERDELSSLDCQKNQLTMNECAKAYFDTYDKKLNSLYQEQLKYFASTESFRNTFKNPTDHAKLLKEAQLKWIEFRDADCLYQAGPKTESSGSMRPLVKFTCMGDLTKQRVKELEKYVACREGGCPF